MGEISFIYFLILIMLFIFDAAFAVAVAVVAAAAASAAFAAATAAATVAAAAAVAPTAFRKKSYANGRIVEVSRKQTFFFLKKKINCCEKLKKKVFVGEMGFV